jgi:hypothetical protein
MVRTLYLAGVMPSDDPKKTVREWTVTADFRFLVDPEPRSKPVQSLSVRQLPGLRLGFVLHCECRSNLID